MSIVFLVDGGLFVFECLSINEGYSILVTPVFIVEQVFILLVLHELKKIYEKLLKKTFFSIFKQMHEVRNYYCQKNNSRFANDYFIINSSVIVITKGVPFCRPPYLILRIILYQHQKYALELFQYVKMFLKLFQIEYI